LDETALVGEIGAEAAEFGWVEALEPAGILLGFVAVFCEDGEDGAAEVAALFAVPCWLFDFDVDAGVAAGGVVEAGDEGEFLVEGGDAERADACGEAVREGGAVGFGVAAFGDDELLEFGDGEVEGVPAAVGAMAVGEAGGGVGDGVDLDIVEDDGDIVFGEDDVLFEEVGGHAVGEGFGFERVFREIAAGTAVGDDEGRGGG
jgi:hypothetical protein